MTCDDGLDTETLLGGTLEIDCLTADGLGAGAVLVLLEAAVTVLPLELEAAAGTTEARFAAGFVVATGVTMFCLTNRPCPGAHWKYL